MNKIPEIVESRLARKDARIAVVGASNNPDKYGNIIVNNLVRKGYTVLPINPREEQVAGLTAYKNVASAPGPIHIVNFVTPPSVTLDVLAELDPKTVEAVWFQDGSFDEEVLRYAKAHFPAVIDHACIMVVTSRFVTPS